MFKETFSRSRQDIALVQNWPDNERVVKRYMNPLLVQNTFEQVDLITQSSNKNIENVFLCQAKEADEQTIEQIILKMNALWHSVFCKLTIPEIT